MKLHLELQNYVNNWASKDFVTIFLTSTKQEKNRDVQKAKQNRYEIVPA